MSWPLSQDYNEAIQSPAANFADPDLRRGEAAANALGIPMPYSGNFADVYQVRCPGGARWAVKCFTREAPGLRERYQRIGEHLRRARLPFTVDFTYLEQGIRVAGKWYPVLKMQWVEGLTLNQFVGQHADRPAMLEALSQIWARMAHYLRAASVGHCDLQHGNVLLVPGSGPNSLALKLIDYDGMWVPALAGKKSGELGHPSYQHPQRAREGAYNLDVDRFPLLLVATSLRALKSGGRALWERYDNGDNLLFKEADLREPAQSALFRELPLLGDPLTAALTARLMKSLSAGLASAPLLEEVLPDLRTTATPAPARAARSAAAKAVNVALVPAMAVGRLEDDPLDFHSSAQGVALPPARKKGAAAAKPGGLPMAAWIAGAAVLVVVAAAAGGLMTWAMSGGSPTPEPKPDTRVAVKDGVPPPSDSRAPQKDKDPPVKDGAIDDPNPPTPPVAPPGPSGQPRVRELPGSPFRGFTVTRALRIAADGNEGFGVGGKDTVCRFDLDTGAVIRTYEFKGLNPQALALSPDGKHAYVCGTGDNLVHDLDLETGQEVRKLSDAGAAALALDVSPDGKRLIGALVNRDLCLWDLETGAESNHWSNLTLARSVYFAPDGARALSYADDQTVRCWDVKTGDMAWALNSLGNGKAAAVGFPADGLHVPIGLTGGMAFLTTVAHSTSWTFNTGVDAPVQAVALSPDGALLAQSFGRVSGNDPHGIQVWDAKATGKINLNRIDGAAVLPGCLAFAPDGRRLFAACLDGVHAYAIDGVPSDPSPVKPPPVKPPPVVKADKLPPPADEALVRALDGVKEAFKADYDALQTPHDRAALSAKLLAEAGAVKEPPARRYALLTQARDLAAEGEDVPAAMRIVEETASAFTINVREAKAAALRAAGKTFSGRAAAKAYLDAALPLVQEARQADDYDLVAPLLPVVRQAAADSFDPERVKNVPVLMTQMERLQEAYQEARPSAQTLKDKPDDPEANLALGKFYCFSKNDWDRGVPLLAKGSDAALADAARKEADTAGFAERTAAGDAWWKASEGNPVLKPGLRRRALLWYDKALPDLTDKEQDRVAGRVIELTKQFPEFATAWADLDVSKVEVVGNCYLRLKPGQSVALKQGVSGSVDVRVVARVAKSPALVKFWQTPGRLIGVWEINGKAASVSYPNVKGVSAPVDSPSAVKADDWSAYGIRLTERGWDALVGDRVFFTDRQLKYDLTRPQIYPVTAVDQVVEIQSFTVKPPS